jgi:cytidylate kinase
MSKIIIAIDGHSSCGKSTMAKALAQQVGYIYVDSGAMYRAVTLFALRHQLFNADGSVKAEELYSRMSEVKVHFKLDPATNLPVTYLNEERVEDEIRTLEVSQHVSPIAALPFVREAMTAAQQAMGEEKGIVMDGRDIGTAVFPNAELKIFVTASAEVRAQRRYDELQTKGLPASYDDILKNVQERDYIDSHREVSPLRQAEDALVLDNSQLTREAQNQWLLDQFEAAVAQASTC